MFEWIMVGCMLIILIVLYAQYQGAAGVRGNMRLSVTLPEAYVTHPEVDAILKSYRTRNNYLLLASIITIIPVFWISYVSFILLYVTLWIVLLMVISNRLFCSYNNRLLLIKSKNRWFDSEADFHLIKREEISKGDSGFMKLLHKALPTPLDKLLHLTTEPIYVDEDEHWINGYYYNPSDPRRMVDKRVGAGMTSNLAKSGKAAGIGAVFLTLMLVGMFVLFLRMDFATFHMEVTDSRVSIDAPFYSYDFTIADIQNVTLTEALPTKGIRTNGAAMEDYLLGNFRYDEYGKVKMYVYRGYPPYLVITLPGQTVIYNSKSEQETKAFYEDLLERTGE